jgi:hypothetical protein
VVGGFSFPAGFDPQQWYSAPSITATLNVTDGSSVTVTCADPLNGTTVSGLNITVSGDGSHQLTCTVTDEGGNESQATTTVNLDASGPVVTAPTAVVTAEATGAAGATVTYSFSASDAYSGATITCAPPSGSTFPIGTTSVTCTATDGAGNTATATFAVTVRDTTAPVITLNGTAAMDVAAGSTFTDPGATAVDAVDGTLAVSATGTVDAAVPGTYTITYTATDAAGNASTASRTVTVIDRTPPVLTLPAPIVTEATGPTGAAVTYAALAADAISGAIAPSCSPASGSTFPVGTSMVTCSAADAAGNTASGSFSVTVRDTTKPVVSLSGQADVTVEAKSEFTDPGATAADLVSGTLTVSVSGTVNTNVVGVYTLTYSATDGSGNTGTATRTVRVADTTRPVVTLNGSAIMTVEAKTTFVDPGATASDTVSGTLAVTVTGAVNTGALGVYALTYTATDGSGNVGTATRTVTVVDTTKPVVTLNGGATLTVEAGTAFVDPGATATDTLAGSLPVSVSGTVQTGVVGTYTLTYSAADPSGNTGTAVRTVTVRDTIAPTVTESITPTSIWSPNGAMVPVTVSGLAADSGSGIASVTYSVVDEYKTVQPSGTIVPAPDGSYSATFLLEASRKGSDKNGRSYTITVTATDKVGLKRSTSQTIVAVEHNLGG